MVVLTDIADSIGQLFLKKGLTQTGIHAVTLQNLPELLGRSGLSVLIWLGIFFYLLNFLLWITVLSRVDLSVAAPVGSSRYLFVLLLATLFLGESIGPLRWAGVIMIIAGICLIFQSGTKHEAEPIS